jgi:hypothetical protein
MNATAASGVTQREDLFRLAVATVLGVVGIFVVVVASESLLSGSVSRPSDTLLFPLLGLYALGLGAWCGVEDRSDTSTVVVSGSYLVGLFALIPVAELIEPVGALTDPNIPLLAVLFVMILGIVQAISYAGYLLGGRLSD